VRVVWKSLVDFFRDNGLMLAGSMSYFSVMAIVPFCLFLITLLGYFLGEYPEFYRFFVNKLGYLFPSGTSETTRGILGLIKHREIGKFGLLLYGLLSYQLFASIENSMDVVFKIGKKRHMFFSLLVALLAVTLIMALLILSFVAATLIPLLTALKEYVPVLRIGKLAGFTITYVIPFVIVFFVLAIAYKLFPNTGVKTPAALKGALFTSLFFETAKHVFTLYVASASQFGKIYGSLTAVILFLLWVFYSCCIFLIGAEIVHNIGSARRS